VRIIAPLLQDKSTDPGVVVVDELGQVALSLCGGHIAGADALTQQVAALLGIAPTLTSASAAYGLPAIDTLGKPFGWQQGQGDWLGVASAVVRACGALTETPVIAVEQDCGWDLWQRQLPATHPFAFSPHPNAAASIWISDRYPPTDSSIPRICWHPRTLWIGLGCERGTPSSTLEQAIRASLAQANLALEAIAGVASIDLKEDEIGLIDLVQQRDWPLQLFSAEILATQPVPHPSEIVAGAVGTPSVAEAAALVAASATDLVVEKQVLRLPGAGACTVAIARSEREYSPRPGQLLLVGTGPGAIAQLTPAARAALAQAEAIVGYQLYVDLVRPLLTPQQIVEASPITQEVQRADRAIALARRGLTVAVISSGDCGIYGMAGLVLERLAATGWDGQRPQVDVLPGITALQAAAARLGAPLMHDFCAISLSDLLTPWSAIERRLEAAAAADFVVALYNPRSRSRTQSIARTRDIFLRHRAPTTPVALARSVYRPDETIRLNTLGDLDIEEIDMVTIVLIGNSQTVRYGDRLITPRGYNSSIGEMGER
jgi:cobalt-precorrin 5A hydrolase/precorrin-3B C17-methyltransferase